MIGGIPKQKTARITDAMTDLQLGIDGFRSRLPEIRDGNQWVHATGAFARISSMFLRKTVLGDRDRRETQLLDDRVLGSISLQFGRLRKIPRDKRREIEVGFSLALVIHNHPHRTAQTSEENLFLVVLIMAPLSQELEPPPNPVRIGL